MIIRTNAIIFLKTHKLVNLLYMITTFHFYDNMFIL